MNDKEFMDELLRHATEVCEHCGHTAHWHYDLLDFCMAKDCECVVFEPTGQSTMEGEVKRV